jgi:hypothetical protein
VAATATGGETLGGTGTDTDEAGAFGVLRGAACTPGTDLTLVNGPGAALAEAALAAGWLIALTTDTLRQVTVTTASQWRRRRGAWLGAVIRFLRAAQDKTNKTNGLLRR